MKSWETRSFFFDLTGIYVPTTDDSNTAQVTGDKMKIGWKFVEHALSYRVYVRPVNGNETHFNVKKNSTELASLKPSTCYVINVKPVFSWGMGPRIVKDFKVKTPSMSSYFLGKLCFSFLRLHSLSNF